MILAAIPIKPFGVAKARLAPVLGQAERSRLGRAIAARTARIAAAAGAEVIVVTADQGVAAWAETESIGVLREDPDLGGGLNGAAATAVRHATDLGVRWAIVHADLPVAAEGDLRTVSKPRLALQSLHRRTTAEQTQSVVEEATSPLRTVRAAMTAAWLQVPRPAGRSSADDRRSAKRTQCCRVCATSPGPWHQGFSSDLLLVIRFVRLERVAGWVERRGCQAPRLARSPRDLRGRPACATRPWSPSEQAERYGRRSEARDYGPSSRSRE